MNESTKKKTYDEKNLLSTWLFDLLILCFSGFCLTGVFFIENIHHLK